MEIATLVYFLNEQAKKYDEPLFFTDNVLENTSIKFEIKKQEGTSLYIELENNQKTETNDLLNRTFKYGNNTITIIEVEISNPIKLVIDTNIKLPKRYFELDRNIQILLSSGYSWNNSINNATYSMNKRVNFSVSIKSDEKGEIYDYILKFVSKCLFNKGNTIEVYDDVQKKLIKNKFIQIVTNVTTSGFIDNRDNAHRVFYIVVRTYYKINRRN